MKFHKYQALGNDYLVVDAPFDHAPPAALIRRICDRSLGLGADGILLGRASAQGFALRIFNPDGSEAEKSGNGLRIYARYLWDGGRVKNDSFTVTTPGGAVSCQVRDQGRTVFVDMGKASFAMAAADAARETLGECLAVDGQQLRFTAVSMGNPHCVLHFDSVSPELARRLGPLIETHPRFPNRTNVQFVKVLDRRRIQIEIWERGAGYTLASGSSSCAAAAVSVKLGMCDGNVDVTMPGGTLQIGVQTDFSVSMVGPVAKVAEGMLAGELLAATT